MILFTRRFRFCLVVCLLWASPVLAQSPICATVAQERAKYQTPISGSDIGKVLNDAAFRHVAEGWKLMRKDSGNKCPQPKSNTSVSCDILLHPPSGHWFDVLMDAEGDGTGQGAPQCADGGLGDMSAAVAPVDPGASAGGGGGTTPPPPLDLSGIYARIDALAAQLTQEHQAQGGLAGQQHQGIRDDGERQYRDLSNQIAEVKTLLVQHDENPSFWRKYRGEILTAIISGIAGLETMRRVNDE